MKKYLVIAVSAFALASCSNDTYLGENVENTKTGANDAIAFFMSTPNMQKGTQDHATSAASLHNEFIVWGEKNEAGDGSAASSGNLVFKNYKVHYTESSAFTSTSNTKDWEYVGLTPYASNVTPKATGDQTIKYWDYGASTYTFTAVSVLPADITGDKIVITKTEAGSGSDHDYDKGYTIDVKAGATIGDIYVSDRNVIDHGTGTNRTADNAYGGVAKMTFRKLAAKIRFAIYETIPGYQVKISKIYYNGTNSTANFGVNGDFVTPGASTQFKVKYGNGSTTGTENKAYVDITDKTPATYFETTSSLFMSTNPIGTTSSAPTYNKDKSAADKGYTEILPNPGNTTNTKLKIDFTMTSTDGSGETIEVREATAEIPAAYCKWQSNFAYTYIFKINDNTNGTAGTVGTDPKGLYPITFDAVVVDDENGKQEVITTVSEPSITTMAVKADGSVETDQNEYAATDTIYASVVDGGSAATLTLANIKLYTVTTDDDTKFPITEASVAERIQEGGTGHITPTAVVSSSSAAPYYATIASVPSEQGTKGTRRTLSAIKWIGAGSTTYAVEYRKISNTTGSAIGVGNSLVGYYTDANCETNAATLGTETVQAGDASTTFYKIDSRTYKIIKVQ